MPPASQGAPGTPGVGLPATGLPATGLPGSHTGLTDVLQVGGALVITLGLLFAGLWLLRRFGQKSGLFARGGLVLEGQLALGPKASVAVVRLHDRRLVLGVTEARVSLLAEESPETEGEDDAIFDEMLDKRR